MTTQLKALFAVASLSVLITGCASNSHELQAAHVSTAGYKAMECTDLHAEMQTNVNMVHELTEVLDEKAEGDRAQMAIGMILFWPALFALEGGDGAEAAEYSRLKGEINAMEQVAIQNQCQPAIKVAADFRAAEQQARVARNADKAEQQKRHADAIAGN